MTLVRSRRSSPLASLSILTALLVVAPLASVAAQRPATDSAAPRALPDSAGLDSLRARLARAEAAIELLRQQLAGESESTVHTRSRFRLDLSAQLLMNAFLTDGRVGNEDVPISVTPPPPAGSTPPTDRALGMTVRQTRFGGALSVDRVLGGTFSGDFELDLFGGVQSGPGDRRLFPEPRLRTAEARMIWDGTELMFGTEAPLISDLNPLSLAAIGTPEFSGAGNLWNWLPQVRLTRELFAVGSGERQLRWAIQGAVLSPFAGQLAPGEPDAVDAGDRASRPALEARLRARWGEDPDATVSEATIARGGGEVGVSLHRGWVAVAQGVTLESHAVAIDGHAVIVPGVELRGEGYSGRLLRGLGGGAIGQNFGVPPVGAPAGTLGAALPDVAGWMQLNVQPHPLVIASTGCGIDLVDGEDHPVRYQNTVCAASLAWRPAQPLVFGLEFRYLATRYSNATYTARHLNLAFGFEL